jgi:hypothetical protein
VLGTPFFLPARTRRLRDLACLADVVEKPYHSHGGLDVHQRRTLRQALGFAASDHAI